MELDRMTGKGWLGRFVASLLLVYVTFNPEGFSYFHWALYPIGAGPSAAARANIPVKLLLGLLLLAIWVFFLRTTRRAIGWKGALLVLAIVATLIWVLIDWNLLDPTSGRVIGHLVLLGLTVVLTLGMSWSHVSRRISGQVDTDESS